MEQAELRVNEVVVSAKKHRCLGLRNELGKCKTGGYLVTYEKLGIFVVATVGPYQAVWITVSGAKRRLLRKFENHPELRTEYHPHQNRSIENEEI